MLNRNQSIILQKESIDLFLADRLAPNFRVTLLLPDKVV